MTLKDDWDTGDIITAADINDIATEINSVRAAVHSFSVSDHGAVGDGVADDTTSIQAAVDAASAAGGGIVSLPTGTFLVSGPIVLSSRVRLVGSGSASTTIKLANGANCNVIESVDYATLSGTNAWLVTADGVPYSFGAEHLRINGNKANNSSGDGIRWYGKRFRIIDVVVHDCAGNGIRTECGATVGQAEVDDMPESRIDQVYVRSNDGHGIHFMGTHDSRMGSLFPLFNGGHGLYINSVAGQYGANCDIEFIHAYGNAGDGINMDTGATVGHMTSEGNDGRGLYCGGATNSTTVIATLWCFNNAADLAGGPSLEIDAPSVMVGSARVVLNNGGTGWLQTGLYGTVNSLLVAGINTNATGLDVQGNGFTLNGGLILNCSAAGGVGVSVGTGLSTVKVSATMLNCDTFVSYVGSSTQRSVFDFRGYTGAGQTAVTGTIPSAQTNRVSHAISGAGGSDTSVYLYDPKITGSLLDTNGNEMLLFTPATSAVNYLTIKNAATGGSPTLVPAGNDSNVGLGVTPKGTGSFYVYCSTGQTPTVEARGTDTDHNLNLKSKGAGVVQANGNPVGVKVSVPASAAATGVPGQWAADSSYIYVCTATNTWMRAAIATWP